MINLKRKKKSSKISKADNTRVNRKMSKKKKILISSFLLILFLAIIGAGDDINEPIKAFSISNETLIVERNEALDLEFTTEDDIQKLLNSTIDCSTDDEAVAVVINRKIFGLSVGETTIRCSADSVTTEPITITIVDTKSTIIKNDENIEQPTDPGDNNEVEQPQTPSPTTPVNPSPSPQNPSDPISTPEPSQPTTPTEPSKPTPPTTSSGPLIVSFIDVGQGDSILIQTPNNKVILIDAGTSSYGPAIERYLKQRDIVMIDVLIATHPHADHIGGMAHIIDRFDIGSIYMPKVSTTTKTFENLLLTIQNKGLKINSARAGIAIDVDSSLKVQMLAPISSSYSDLNQYSAVLKVSYKNTSFLFTGDAGQISEQEMMSSGAILRADVLKVGHHGSHTSSTVPFLNAVKPSFAIITVGKDNRYGHPHQEILDRLSSFEIKTYRTDIHGTIIFTSDGQTIKVNK